MQSLLDREAEVINFLLYLFNQGLPNIQDAVILDGSKIVRTHDSYRASHHETRYWSAQIQQPQSPETKPAVSYSTGA